MNKINALKSLEFNFITRDENGELNAWIEKPIKIIYVNSKEWKEPILENNIFTKFECYDTNDKNFYQNDYLGYWGRNINESPEIFLYGRIYLKDDNEYKDITWENGIYEIK